MKTAPRTATGRFDVASIDTISRIQFGHRQFPQIHVLPCGDWLVTFVWTDDAYFAKGGYLRSRDRGKTWEEDGWPTDSGLPINLGGDEVAFFDSYYPIHKGGDDFAIQATFSRDGGRTFAPPEYSIPVHCPGARVHSLAEMMQWYFSLPCFPWNNFFKANGYPPIAPGWPETAKQIKLGASGPSAQTIRLDDGRLISMSYCKGSRPDVDVDYFFTYALESTDRGRSWRQVGTVPWEPALGGEGAMFGNTGFTEAGLAQLDSGELLIVLRVGSHFPMATSRSSDLGRTWSKPEQVRLENTDGDFAKGVYPVMKRLSNGWLACVYGRPGIHLMVDPTGTGRHWRHQVDFTSIERERCRRQGADLHAYYSTENIGLAELAPGELGITYDLVHWHESPDRPWVRQAIRLARLTLA